MVYLFPLPAGIVIFGICHTICNLLLPAESAEAESWGLSWQESIFCGL